MVIIDKRESVEMRQFNDFVKSKHFKIFLERKRVDKKCLRDMDGLKLARNYLYEELEQYLPKDQIERRVDFKDANDMKMQIGKYWSQYRQIVEAHENNKALKDDDRDNGDAKRFHPLEYRDIRCSQIPSGNSPRVSGIRCGRF